MRHLALLSAAFALLAALVMPGSLFAQESTEAAPAGTAPAGAPPAQPAPPAEPAPAPAEPVAPPPPPEPQVLADEREEAAPIAFAAASGSVTIVDFSFSPGTITINQGETVTWNNSGPTPHSATASNGSFDTGIFSAGQSRSHTFTEAGSFSYFCTPHPNMRGAVVVQAAQSGADTPDSSSGATGGAADAGTPGEAAQSDGGPALPNSGADSGALFAFGLLLLLLGVAVHRRVRPE